MNCATNSTYRAWAPVAATVSASASDADEDGSLVFLINTSNLADGETLFYTLSGAGVTTSDFQGTALSGFVTVSDNQAIVTVNLREDELEEGVETVTLTAYRTLASDGADINDTSRSYQPDPSLVRAWFDASRSDSLTISGGSVAQWNDLGPFGLHVGQSNPSKRPTYVNSGWNGSSKPYLDWGTENNSLLLENATSGISVQEAFIVAQFGGAGFTSYHGLLTDTSAGENGIVLLTNSSGSNVYSGGFFHPNIFLNGVINSSGTLLPSISSPFVIHARSSSPVSLQGLVVGCDRAPYCTSRGWRGKIAEILIYSDVLSAATRAKTEGYLAWKWGIQSTLEVTHPYRNVNP